MNALTSLWDGSLSGKREQTILTPKWLTALLVEEWGEIGYDPCPEPTLFDEAPNVPAKVLARPPGLGAPGTGFDQPWPDKTYCNPPYGELKQWLAFAVEQEGVRALLCPNRSHRPWFRKAAATCSAIVELNGVKFVGYAQPFPAPLVLLCWGWSPTAELWRKRGGVRDVDPEHVWP